MVTHASSIWSRSIALLALALLMPATVCSTECDKAAVTSELQSMLRRDQYGRSSFSAATADADSADSIRLAGIVETCGWPRVSYFGEKAALGAFLVLQHGSLRLQLKYVPLLRSASLKGELVPGTLPLLEDRIRVRQGLPQLYGTQISGSGQPYPIKDPDNLDARRRAAGLVPYADYLKLVNGR